MLQVAIAGSMISESFSHQLAVVGRDDLTMNNHVGPG